MASAVLSPLIKERPSIRPSSQFVSVFFDDNHICRMELARLLGILRFGEDHGLSFYEAEFTFLLVGLYCARMAKDVTFPLPGPDEAEALLGVPPYHRAFLTTLSTSTASASGFCEQAQRKAMVD